MVPVMVERVARSMHAEATGHSLHDAAFVFDEESKEIRAWWFGVARERLLAWRQGHSREPPGVAYQVGCGDEATWRELIDEACRDAG